MRKKKLRQGGDKSEKAFEMISTLDSSFVRSIVRLFICLLARLPRVCARANTLTRTLVFRFPFRFSAYFIITIMTKY